MKSFLVEVDDELAGRLEQVAPAWEDEEQATAEAYARHPDSSDAAFDPAVWEGRSYTNCLN